MYKGKMLHALAPTISDIFFCFSFFSCQPCSFLLFFQKPSIPVAQGPGSCCSFR